MTRVAVLALLLLTAACTLAGTAGAATRPVTFTPVVAPAAGTCEIGSSHAPRVLLARDAASRAEVAPCLGGTIPSGRVLLVLAPDSMAAGTTVTVRRVEVVGTGGQRTLRVTASFAAPPADALLAQVLTTPRTAVRLGAGSLPRAWMLVDRAGAVLARGRT